MRSITYRTLSLLTCRGTSESVSCHLRSQRITHGLCPPCPSHPTGVVPTCTVKSLSWAQIIYGLSCADLSLHYGGSLTALAQCSCPHTADCSPPPRALPDDFKQVSWQLVPVPSQLQEISADQLMIRKIKLLISRRSSVISPCCDFRNSLWSL